jgi:hypothetical protein
MAKRKEHVCTSCGHHGLVAPTNTSELCVACKLRLRAQRHRDTAERFDERACVIQTIRRRRENPDGRYECEGCGRRGTASDLEDKRRVRHCGCYWSSGVCPDCQSGIEVAG